MATIESAALELTSLMRNVCESVVEQTGARLIETIHARNNYIMELEGRLLTMDSALVTAERDLFTARSAIGDLEKERDAMLQKKQMKKEKRDAEKREMKKENETSPKESPPVQMTNSTPSRKREREEPRPLELSAFPGGDVLSKLLLDRLPRTMVSEIVGTFNKHARSGAQRSIALGGVNTICTYPCTGAYYGCFKTMIDYVLTELREGNSDVTLLVTPAPNRVLVVIGHARSSFQASDVVNAIKKSKVYSASFVTSSYRNYVYIRE